MNEEELKELLDKGDRILQESNKALSFEIAKKGHFLSEEFLKRENPTIDEYNASNKNVSLRDYLLENTKK